MERQTLISTILDQQQVFRSLKFVPRLQDKKLSEDNEIIVISGIRRCGKSTLLHEIRESNNEKDYVLNFDDERLIHFTVDDFQKLFEIFIELFGEQSTFYFDEIQNVKGWERFVRRLYDSGNKVYITGSNASMLSRELGTHLTGRYYQFELYPFSFKEFLALKDVKYSKNSFFTTNGKALLKNKFNDFFSKGGFPDYLQNENKQYLKSLYESILYRDVMVRNNLTKEKEILELVYYLASNVSKLVTYNSLKKVISVQNATTIKKYLEYLQNSYLIFLINKYDFSLKKQLQNPKKAYLIDNALSNELGFHSSEDRGRLLENMVFIELKRRGKNIYYHKQKQECDFVLREKNKIVNAIQVSWSLYEEKTRKREINGLIEAMNLYNLKSGLILTENEEETIRDDGLVIHIRPVWQWLLDEELLD